MEVVSQMLDSSFKYFLLGFNLLTLLAVYIHKKRMVFKKEHHILFLFAHPDDEAMFFGPTIASLAPQYFIHFLCLSHGQSHRAEELALSARYFGAHHHLCLHDERMIDGMKSNWDTNAITQALQHYVQQHNIRAIFTFDQHGVSGHFNHRAIHHALARLEVLEQGEGSQTQGDQGDQGAPIKVYYLQTTNLLRKYCGLLELPIMVFKQFSFVRFNYLHGFNSMMMHKSQFVWFRHLFVLFSRYTYINTYQMRRIKFQ